MMLRRSLYTILFTKQGHLVSILLNVRAHRSLTVIRDGRTGTSDSCERQCSFVRYVHLPRAHRLVSASAVKQEFQENVEDIHN